jgi:hypothetical protein
MSGLRQRHGASHTDSDEGSKGKGRRGIDLATFDLYQKVQAEEAVQTSTGAGVSIVAFVVIAILVLSELYGYFVPTIKEHMLVDPVIEGRLPINFDIEFPALHCQEVNLDAMDVAGEQQNGLAHDVTKTRLGADRKSIGQPIAAPLVSRNASDVEAGPTPLPADYCGSCYGAAKAEGQCCNSCDDLRAAYVEKSWDSTSILRDSEQCQRDAAVANGGSFSKAGEGCRIAGTMTVNKVAGNFHIAMGETHARGAGHIHQFNPAAILAYNVTHTVHRLSFGENIEVGGVPRRGPLDGQVMTPVEGAGVFMFYIKVIPTVWVRGGGRANVTTNQYSVTRQYRAAVVHGQRQNVLPGVFFVYEISPFMVSITAHTTPLASVITNLCAILGGIIAAATLADQVLYRLTKTVGQVAKVPAGGAQGALVEALAAGVAQVQRAAAYIPSPSAGGGGGQGYTPVSAGPAGASGPGRTYSPAVSSSPSLSMGGGSPSASGSYTSPHVNYGGEAAWGSGGGDAQPGQYGAKRAE